MLFLSLGVSGLLPQIGFGNPEYIRFWFGDSIRPEVVAVHLSPRMHR